LSTDIAHTGSAPLTTSMAVTGMPAASPAILVALVAPTLPEPSRRMSLPVSAHTTSSPDGIDPSK
jgi:hypothetical protein